MECGPGIVEVVEILVGADPCAHGTDVETEEGTSDGAKGREDYVALVIRRGRYRCGDTYHRYC